MKTAMALAMAAMLGLLSLAVAQENDDVQGNDEIVLQGGERQVLPGVTITVNPDLEGAEFVVAQEISYQPNFVVSVIEYGDSFTPLTVSFSSTVDTKIRVEASDAARLLLARSRDEVTVLSGSRVSVGFTAYEPHRGHINVYNENDELLTVVPYVVKAENQVRQTLGATARTTGVIDGGSRDVSFDYGYDVNASYAITERETGITGRVNIGFDGHDVRISSQVSGEYSW